MQKYIHQSQTEMTVKSEERSPFAEGVRKVRGEQATSHLPSKCCVPITSCPAETLQPGKNAGTVVFGKTYDSTCTAAAAAAASAAASVFHRKASEPKFTYKREWKIEEIPSRNLTNPDLTLNHSFQTDRLTELESEGWTIHTIGTQTGTDAIRVFLYRRVVAT